jgi:hypothetical protein
MIRSFEYCLTCGPAVKLDQDDFDSCKRCQLKEVKDWRDTYKQLADYLIQQIPEANREQVAKAAYSSIR